MNVSFWLDTDVTVEDVHDRRLCDRAFTYKQEAYRMFKAMPEITLSTIDISVLVECQCERGILSPSRPSIAAPWFKSH